MGGVPGVCLQWSHLSQSFVYCDRRCHCCLFAVICLLWAYISLSFNICCAQKCHSHLCAMINYVTVVSLPWSEVWLSFVCCDQRSWSRWRYFSCRTLVCHVTCRRLSLCRQKLTTLSQNSSTGRSCGAVALLSICHSLSQSVRRVTMLFTCHHCHIVCNNDQPSLSVCQPTYFEPFSKPGIWSVWLLQACAARGLSERGPVIKQGPHQVQNYFFIKWVWVLVLGLFIFLSAVPSCSSRLKGLEAKVVNASEEGEDSDSATLVQCFWELWYRLSQVYVMDKRLLLLCDLMLCYCEHWFNVSVSCGAGSARLMSWINSCYCCVTWCYVIVSIGLMFLWVVVPAQPGLCHG